jgi:glyoxylase-like metal-dependent hydrolase (beta-lactamase superfamily II)
VKDGVLVSADHLLGRISPTVGLWPESRPDPLGDFIGSLLRTIELAPTFALPGHGEPLQDPVRRAYELIEHHRERLAATEAALTDEPRSGYAVSFDLFGRDLKPAARRFAVAETLSHLERLVLEERARRREDVGFVAYTARQLGRRAT